MSGMARAVELLGLRACLTQSTMDCGQGLPGNWALHTTDYCIEVELILLSLTVVLNILFVIIDGIQIWVL